MLGFFFFGHLATFWSSGINLVTSLQQANIYFSFWRPKKKRVRRRRPMRWTCPRPTPALKKRKTKFKKILKFLTQYKYSKHLNSGHTNMGQCGISHGKVPILWSAYMSLSLDRTKRRSFFRVLSRRFTIVLLTGRLKAFIWGFFST